MNITTQECRWRHVPSTRTCNYGPPEAAAWESGCGQWCVESEGTPQADGFRNGFEFCPYCGNTLVLLLRPAEAVA